MRPVIMAALSEGASGASGGGGGGGSGGTATFNPVPGTYNANDNVSFGHASFTINASQSVKWNWSATGNIPSCTVADGGSATSITFSMATSVNSKSSVITVTVGSDTWTINMSVTGTG